MKIFTDEKEGFWAPFPENIQILRNTDTNF